MKLFMISNQTLAKQTSNYPEAYFEKAECLKSLGI